MIFQWKKSDCICQAKQFLYIFFFKKYDKYKRNYLCNKR